VEGEVCGGEKSVLGKLDRTTAVVLLARNTRPFRDLNTMISFVVFFSFVAVPPLDLVKIDPTHKPDPNPPENSGF